MTLEELLRQGKSFGQGASNAAASTVTGPVDMLAWLLRKGGVPVGDTPIGGEAWMRQKGLMATPENRLAGLLGEGAGLAAPIVAAAKAPEIAGGLLQMGRNLAAPQTMNKQTGAIVYHGSPHKFDKFDSSKIGTGEGAQAYGHGLYLAESPQVATTYIPTNEAGKSAIAKQLQTETKRAARYSNEGAQEVFEMFNKGYTPQAIRSNIDNILESGDVHPAYAKKMNQAYEKGMQIFQQNAGGSLYKVDLPDEHIAKMLDWDKPLSQQHPDVQKALNKFGVSGGESAEQIAARMRSLGYSEADAIEYGAKNAFETNGQIAYRNLHESAIKSGKALPAKVKEAQVAEQLRKAGIPGIRYLDGGSRGAGTGSSNFVVFPGNEGLLKILERNGGKP